MSYASSANPDRAGERNRDFVQAMVRLARDEVMRIGEHSLYRQMADGVLPWEVIHAYLGEMVPLFQGTMDRAIRRAERAPSSETKRTWLRWACEEFGHADMLLDVIALTDGDPARWASEHVGTYEAVALRSYLWDLTYRATYLENAASVFLATENLLSHTLPRFGRLLLERYAAPPQAMKIFAEHKESDAGHVAYGIQLLEAAPSFDETDKARIERAIRMTFLCHERWHDGLIRTYGGKVA